MPDDFLNANLGVADEFQKYNAAKEQMPPIEISSTNKGGNLLHTLTMDDQTLQGILQKMQYTEQAMQSMTQEVNRLQQREQQVRQHPILNALSQVAGNLAVTDKRLPPLVAALGRSSLALNPTPDQLGQQRLGLQEQIGKLGLEGAQQGLNILREDRLERRMQAEVEEKKKSDAASIFRNLSVAAQKGELTDPKITAKVIEDAGAKPEVAASQAAQLVAVSQAKRELDAKVAEAKDIKEKAALAERAREADQHTDTILRGLAIHAEMAERARAFKEEADAKKAATKDDAQRKKIPATLPDKLANLTAAEKSLDEVEAGLKKYAKYQGVVAGRTLEPIATYLNTDVAKFFNKMRIQVAQVIKSTGAGARGFGPMERSYFEKLAESKNHSPAENLGIIESWRDYLRQNRASYYETYEGIRDPKYKRAFGKDADALFQDQDADPLGVLK